MLLILLFPCLYRLKIAFLRIHSLSIYRVLSYPENPPQINFEEYRKKVSSKEAVNQLEAAYKALKVTYPKDTLSHEVDKQEEEYKKNALAYVDVANAKIAEAEKLVSIVTFCCDGGDDEDVNVLMSILF